MARTTWTLQHENDTQTKVPSTISLKLAFESGYRWVNKNDGLGWKQIAYLLRRGETGRA